MSFSEVKELRKSGQLEEALKMAQEDLKSNPHDIWNKRSISWVYYEYLKKYADQSDFKYFKTILLKLKELELSEEEKMLFDSSAWQIGKMIYSLSGNKNNIEEHKIRELFEIIKKRAPHIKCILDNSAANRLYVKNIYDTEIKKTKQKKLKTENESLYNKYFLNRIENEIKFSDYFIAPSNFV